MDSEEDTNARPMAQNESDAEYSDNCDYDEYNEEEFFGDDERLKETPECSHSSSDPEFVNYDCLTVPEVETMVNNWVSEVTDVFSIQPSQAKLLLQLNNWDIVTIKKEATSNAEEFLVKNGLKGKEKPAPKTERRLGMELRSKIAKKEPKKQQCGVCWEEDVELTSLNCGHVFCTVCWSNYVKTQIDENHSRIVCMEPKCGVYCQEDFVRKILSSQPILYSKYEQALYREMISSNPVLCFCPGPDCQTIIYSTTKKAHRVTCKSCHTLFCFQCGQNYHAPASCEIIKKWLRKCADDSETANYISANTKDCPKCHASIEKNGGCNHMHCTKCGEHFCWVCCQDWKSHGSAYYNCSRYNEGTETNKADARKSLERYLHYFTRYENHMKSLKLERELLDRIKERIDQKVANHEGTWIDWQYLYDAASLLTRCRYTLQYTYPFAFYMVEDEDVGQKELFEYQQSHLEKEIEELSWKVERAESTDRGELEVQMHVSEQKRRILLQDFLKRKRKSEKSEDDTEVKVPWWMIKHKPNPSKFFQQDLEACRPLPSFRITLGLALFFGVTFIPLGCFMVVSFNSVKSYNITYGNGLCNVTGITCLYTFDLNESFTGEVFFYYGIDGYYQNLRRYTNSYSPMQFTGEFDEIDECTKRYDHEEIKNANNKSECDKQSGKWLRKEIWYSDSFPPFIKDWFWARLSEMQISSNSCYTKPYAPCGIIANSFFNDSFELFDYENNRVPMTYDGLLHYWEKDDQFNNPDARNNQELCDIFNNRSVKPKSWSKSPCQLDPDNLNNTGFKNFDFIVWMRRTISSSFRKNYRKLDRESTSKYKNGLPSGQYKLIVSNNYDVSAMNARKYFYISTVSWIGAGNWPFLGYMYIIVGSCCLASAGFLIFVHLRYGHTFYEMVNIPLDMEYVRNKCA